MDFWSNRDSDLRDRCHCANMFLCLLHGIANKPFVSKVITLLKANMVSVIFLTIINVLCSVCGEDSGVLNALVLR